jgi:hypothetical protein
MRPQMARTPMTVYFGLYKINENLPPAPNPNDAVKQFEGFAAAIKMQMQSGDLKEAHAFVGTNGGYFITGDISPEKIDQMLATFFPYVTFETYQTIPLEKSIQNAIGVAKMRASMM